MTIENKIYVINTKRNKLVLVTVSLIAFGLMLSAINVPDDIIAYANEDDDDGDNDDDDDGDNGENGKINGCEGVSSTFDVQEATIADIHEAIEEEELTSVELVCLYLDRISAFNGVCVNQPEGILGVISTIPNAGQVNALMTLNLRPDTREAMGFDDRKARSMTDNIDNDPNMPDALEVAAELDKHFANTGELIGPMHGIVFSLKDQYDTFDMRTTQGADAFFANDRPPDDATFVKKLRDAGAIILAKANMGEYASGDRSAFGGVTCNPYDTERSPGRSSGGSGASVAANLVTCSVGEESGGSVVNPARHNNVVGLPASVELVSRDGMYATRLAVNDRIGPMCRTVNDVARVLDVIAGYDPKDPTTAFSIGRQPSQTYESFANEVDLTGITIGVVREYMDKSLFNIVDVQTIDAIDDAIDDLEALGATIVDPKQGNNAGALFQDCLDKFLPAVNNKLYINQFPEAFPVDEDGNPTEDHIPLLVDMFLDPSLVPHTDLEINFRDVGGAGSDGVTKFKTDLYLQERGDANIQSTADLIDKSNFFTDIRGGFSDKEARLIRNNDALTLDDNDPRGRFYTLQLIGLQCFALNGLDALVHPTTNIPAPKLGFPTESTLNDRRHLAWNLLPGSAAFPIITVPAGFTTQVFDRDADRNLIGPIAAELPIGITFLGKPFGEPTLFKIASAYEAATNHRTPPPDFGAVDENGIPLNAVTPGEPREMPEPRELDDDELDDDEQNQ